MAFTSSVLRNTNQETIIKFQGVANDTGTISIAGLTAGTQARNSDNPVVRIVRIMCSGLSASNLTINRRDGVGAGGTTWQPIFYGSPSAVIDIDLTSNGFSDSTNSTGDLQFSITGGGVTGYITLRKIAGWDTTVETANFGAKDNQAAVGS
jgi:hypothetical protein